MLEVQPASYSKKPINEVGGFAPHIDGLPGRMEFKRGLWANLANNFAPIDPHSRYFGACGGAQQAVTRSNKCPRS